MLNKTKAAVQGRLSLTTYNAQNTITALGMGKVAGSHSLVLPTEPMILALLIFPCRDGSDCELILLAHKSALHLINLPEIFGLPNTISTPKYLGTAYRGKVAPKILGYAQGAKKHLGYNSLYSRQSSKLSPLISLRFLEELALDKGVCTNLTANHKACGVVVQLLHKPRKAFKLVAFRAQPQLFSTFLSDSSGVTMTSRNKNNVLCQSAKSHSRRNSLYLRQSVKLRRVHSPKYLGQPLGSSFGFFRCRRLISPRRAVTIYCAALSFFSLVASIPSTTSSGILTVLCCDLLLRVPVAICLPINYVGGIHYTCKKEKWKILTWDSLWLTLCESHLCFLKWNKQSPASVSPPAGPLTTMLVEVTIMAEMQSTQTHPKFIYRFLALNRADLKSELCSLSVEACTEKEARQVFAPHFILSFAARLPVQGVTHD